MASERFEVVPLAALVFGASSFIAPFAALKANRIVDGVLMSGAALSSPLIAVLAILCTLGVLIGASVLKPLPGRRWIYAVVGAGCFWLTAGLMVRAGTLLGEGAAPRVSPAIGFWGLPVASYILINHSQLFKWRGGGLILALILLVPTVLLLAGGRGEAISVIREWQARRSRFNNEIILHIRLFVTGVTLAGIMGIPLGVVASRDRRIGGPVLAFVDAAQTIPSMALFGLLMAPLAALSQGVPALRALGVRGIGTTPALIALTLYALLPIVKNTVAGLAAVPLSAFDAGRGMGMSSRQLFWRVEGPMALPHILTGLRTASIQAVGNTAVAALIGAGGLGIMIFQGLGQAAPDLILLGVLPLILMAVAVDRLWGFIILRVVSPGLQGEGRSA